MNNVDTTKTIDLTNYSKSVFSNLQIQVSTSIFNSGTGLGDYTIKFGLLKSPNELSPGKFANLYSSNAFTTEHEVLFTETNNIGPSVTQNRTTIQNFNLDQELINGDIIPNLLNQNIRRQILGFTVFFSFESVDIDFISDPFININCDINSTINNDL